jgi:hypothetical protein
VTSADASSTTVERVDASTIDDVVSTTPIVSVAPLDSTVPAGQVCSTDVECVAIDGQYCKSNVCVVFVELGGECHESLAALYQSRCNPATSVCKSTKNMLGAAGVCTAKKEPTTVASTVKVRVVWTQLYVWAAGCFLV